MKIYDHSRKRNLCGIRIRQTRLKQKLSQYDLAIQMQLEGSIVEANTICKIENGTRSVFDYELPSFAKTLHVSVNWLLGLTD